MVYKIKSNFIMKKCVNRNKKILKEPLFSTLDLHLQLSLDLYFVKNIVDPLVVLVVQYVE